MTPDQRILTDILYETIKIRGDTYHIADTSMRLIDMKLTELVNFTMRIPETDDLLLRIDEIINIVNFYSLVFTGLLGIIIGLVLGICIMRIICK